MKKNEDDLVWMVGTRQSVLQDAYTAGPDNEPDVLALHMKEGEFLVGKARDGSLEVLREKTAHGLVDVAGGLDDLRSRIHAIEITSDLYEIGDFFYVTRDINLRILKLKDEGACREDLPAELHLVVDAGGAYQIRSAAEDHPILVQGLIADAVDHSQIFDVDQVLRASTQNAPLRDDSLTV